MRTIVSLFYCWAFIGALFAQETSGEGTSRSRRISRREVKTPEELLQIGYRAYGEGDWTLVIQSLGEAARTFRDNDLLHLYLGTAYQILGNDLQAGETLIRGVNLQGENMQKIAFVLGNYYYSTGQYAKAVDAYNLATWGEKQMVQAFLNRANLYLSLGFYSNALNDYSYFLFRKPFNSQRSNIEAIIRKLMELGAEGRIQADQKVAPLQAYPQIGALNGLAPSQLGEGLPEAGQGSTNQQGNGAGQGNFGTNGADQVSSGANQQGNRAVNNSGQGNSGGNGTANNSGQGSANQPGNGVSQGSTNQQGNGAGQGNSGTNGADQGSSGANQQGNGAINNSGQGNSGGNETANNSGQGTGQGRQPDNGLANNPDARGNSLEDGIYRRPEGDTGNTVGTGGSFQAQMQQLNGVRNSLSKLNRSAIILDRSPSDLIEQQEIFPEIDE